MVDRERPRPTGTRDSSLPRVASIYRTPEWHAETRALTMRAQSGCPDAFGELYLRTRGLVYDRVLRVSGPELADDAVQEAYAKAFAGIAKLRNPGAFPFWVASIAQNAARLMQKNAVGHFDGRPHDSLDARVDHFGNEGPESPDDPEEEVLSAIRHASLTEGFIRERFVLSAGRREILDLAMQGFSHQDIATETRKSYVNVQVSIKRVRDTMKRRLGIEE